MVGGGGWAQSYAEVDLPLGRNIQVGDGKDLLLLVKIQIIENTQASVASAVFETDAYPRREGLNDNFVMLASASCRFWDELFGLLFETPETLFAVRKRPPIAGGHSLIRSIQEASMRLTITVEG